MNKGGKFVKKLSVVLGRQTVGHETIYFFSTFFFGLLTDVQKTFTETECLPFQCVKKHLPKHSVCFPMKHHIKHIDLGIKVC